MFADADGATDINDLGKVLAEVKKAEKNGLSCAIGCRNSDEAQVQVTFPQIGLVLIIQLED